MTSETGVFFCEKRQQPRCCAIFCCLPCIVTNYEGFTCAAILLWILWLSQAVFGPPVVKVLVAKLSVAATELKLTPATELELLWNTKVFAIIASENPALAASFATIASLGLLYDLVALYLACTYVPPLLRGAGPPAVGPPVAATKRQASSGVVSDPASAGGGGAGPDNMYNTF